MAEKDSDSEELVFMSYGREPEVIRFVEQLTRDLQANGFTVWLDQESISSGSDWHGAIATGLHKCAYFLPVVTQKYANSRYCMNELYTADGDQKMLFPVMYDDPQHIDFESTENGRSLKFIISGINWTMFRPGVDDYGKSLNKLIQGMKTKANHRSQASKDVEGTAVVTVGPTSAEPIKVISGLQYPANVATGRNGEIIVANYMNHNVSVYNSEYELVRTIGSQGYMDGQFMCPNGIAIDKRNRIFVSSMSKVDVFNMEGQFLNSFGSQGNEPLQFTNACGIAFGKKGEIYVADAQNNRVQVLNSDLTYRNSISEGSSNHGAGKLSQPQGVAVNSEGNVYVVDMMNHCVQAFDPDGSFLLAFGEFGAATVAGSMCSPMAITIDGKDHVYVGSSNGSMSIFDKEGKFLRTFGSYGSKLGQFSVIRGLHIDVQGRLYVSEWNSNRIQIFEGTQSMKKRQEEVFDDVSKSETDHLQGSSKPAYMIGPTSATPVKIIEMKEPYGVAEGKNGEIVVADRSEHKLFVYNRNDDYQLIATIGSEGSFDGMLRYPTDVAFTPDNIVLVASSDMIQWFTIDGKLVYSVGSSGKEEMQFDDPEAVAISRDGNVYVLDKGNSRVQIFDGDGSYNRCFNFPQKEEFNSLAVNSEGNLYFAYSSENCIHVFSSDGEFLFKFGKSGSVMERGTLHSPNVIVIDNDDYVFVASVMMISIFDKTGTFIKAFGGNGDDPGQFSFIMKMSISNSNHLYVSDYGNNRIQIFEINQTPTTDEDHDRDIKMISSCRRPVYTIGPSSDVPVQILSGGEIGEPVGVAVSDSGDILVLNKKKKKVVVFDGETYEPKEDDEITQLLWETSRDTEIVDPSYIAVCEDGCLLMSVNHQLVKLTMTEEVIASVGTRGRHGNSNQELDRPNGIAISKNGLIYVADKDNHRVQIFNPDLSYRGTCEIPDFMRNSDMDPECVAVNSKGTVYVTDCRHHCVYVFDANGKFLFVFGQKRGQGSTYSAVAIAVDSEDYLYVSSSDNHISIFDGEGNFIRTFRESGEDKESFEKIKAMHIDSKGNLYVCETKHNSIRIFAGIQPQPQDHTFTRETSHDVLPKVVVSNSVKDPIGIAEGKNKEIVVVSSTDHKVYVFNQQCQLLAEFGGKGDLDGYFNTPTSVAVTSDNYILVSSHDKLQWFTMTGQLVYAVGKSGREEVEFDHPDSIDVGKDGKIYVLENKNKRVQILKGNASYYSHFELKTDHLLQALAVNSDGNIHLIDTRNSCVRILSPKGESLKGISYTGSNDLARPTAVSIDVNDHVYIGTATGLVVVFNKEGQHLHTFCGASSDSEQSPASHFNLISDLHVSPSGHIYVSKFTNNQVEILGPFKEFSLEHETAQTPSPSTAPKVLPHRPVYTYGPVSTTPVKEIKIIQEPSAIITGPYNDIVITSCRDNKIFAYNPAQNTLSPIVMKLVNRVGSNQTLHCPSGLALTADGHFLVSSENQLLKLAFDGTVVAFVGNERKCSGESNSELDQPKSIAVSKEGQIYVVDHGNHRIQIFDKNLQYVKTLCNPDSSERRYERFESIAFNSAGDLFITDSYNCKIQVYSKTGRFRLAFGTKSSRKYIRGCLSSPHAIAIDREDFVYVGDEKGIISIFNKKGKFLRSFGGAGSTPGLFGSIQSMHIDSQGLLYIGESENHRIQVFQIQQRQ